MCLHPLKQHRDVVSSDVVPNKHIRVETVQLCDEEVEQRALRRAHLQFEPLVRRNRALQVPRPGALLELAHHREASEGRGLAVAPSTATLVCVITDAIATSGTCFALRTVCRCRLATTSGGGGGGLSSTCTALRPCKSTSYLHHELDALAGLAPLSLSQHGPITLRFRSSSSRAEVCVPKRRRKYVPEASFGSAGYSAEYTSFRYEAECGTSASSNA